MSARDAGRFLRIQRIHALRRLRWDNRLLLLAAAIGLAGGLLAAVYYLVLVGLTRWIWVTGPLSRWPMPVTCALGGALVGLAVRWLGSPVEISTVVNNIHLKEGRLDPRRSPSMAVNSLLSIAFGGSAGPEAPLVQICGSLGTWLGDKLRVRPRVIRTVTLSGMAAALGSFFGAPLGGALFALEIPHRRGLEYYEALMPAILSAAFAFLVLHGLTAAGVHWPFPPHLPPGLRDVGLGIGFGLVGAAAATLFIALFRTLFRALDRAPLHPVVRGAGGGLLLGLLSWHHPETLFFSEQQIALLFSAHHGAAGWLLLALIKAVAIGVTLGSGFRGGFIFPLFFIGACLGQAMHAFAPSIDVSLAMLAIMAGINVGVTKTPIATTVILVTLSGLSVFPVVLFASLASFLATLPIGMIETQASRARTAEG